MGPPAVLPEVYAPEALLQALERDGSAVAPRWACGRAVGAAWPLAG